MKKLVYLLCCLFRLSAGFAACIINNLKKISFLFHYIPKKMYICNVFRKRYKTYLLDSLSFTTTRKRANAHEGAAPSGADFPYMCMVCGEPRGVWRWSAPFLFTNVSP